VNDARYATAQLSEIPPSSGGWLPVRRHFGLEAFGVNAWRVGPGENVIGEHQETESGHEELYVVLEGHATFTVDDQEIDAPAGTLVFVRNPELKRGAVSRAEGTTVLAVGAKRGEAFVPMPWEENAEIIPLFGQGQFAEAKRRLESALERHPEAPGLVYNLACAEAQLGETDAALEHLRFAVERQPQLRELAQDDPDLESIRAEAGFPAR
jgi:tetratricopeptide (TPR) repeat protein